MSIEPPEPLASFLGRPTSQSTRWFLDLPDESRKAIQLQPLEVAFVAVGPEGGWTEAEGAAARQAGWQIVSLGARTLRVETAAVAAAAAITLGESSSADQR